MFLAWLARPYDHGVNVHAVALGSLDPDDPRPASQQIAIDKHSMPIYDVLGKEVPLSQFAADNVNDDMLAQYVQQARAWFDSVWNTIAYEPAS